MYALVIAAAASTGLVGSVAGVYKTRFKNALYLEAVKDFEAKGITPRKG